MRYTWNAEFDALMVSCHLTPETVLELDDGDLIGDCCWMRYGGKVSVACGNAIWTVGEDELRDAALAAKGEQS